MIKVPLSEVTTPAPVLPKIVTETDGTGFSFSSTTLPETEADFFCAATVNENAINNKNSICERNPLISIRFKLGFVLTEERKNSGYIFKLADSLCRITRFKNGISGNQNIGTSCYDRCRIVKCYATINFN